jgi:hypothetical protein
MSPDDRTAHGAERAGVGDFARAAAGWVRGVYRSTLQRMRQARTRHIRNWLDTTQVVSAARQDRRAMRRSLVLLLRVMSPEQRREFRERRYFHVIGARSGNRYRIRTEWIANIDVIGYDGRVGCRLCVRPAGGVPLYDAMAAQLLQLQDPRAEQRLLQQANVLSALFEAP